MDRKVKQLTAIGMLCALAYAAAVIGRVPLVLFLKYDPKDIIIAISGLMFGPAASLGVALLVSFVEMLTISETGIWGFLMNVISSASFSCTTAYIYQKRPKFSGAMMGAALRMGVHGFRHAALERSHCPYLHGLSQRNCQRIAHPGISPL